MKRIAWIVVVLVSLACPAVHAADGDVLNIYNWAEYFAPDTMAFFEKATGIKVRLDVYDSNEALQTKLTTGNSGYDLVFPSNDFLARQIQAGLYQKPDKSKLPNLKNLDPAIVARAAEVDPGNQYSVPYMQGTFGLGLNVAKVKQALGGPLPANTLDLIFDPAYATKLEGCGIAFNDAGSEVFPLALRYIGRDPNTTDPRDYEAALQMMKKIRPTIRQFIATPVMNDLATGDVCVVTGYSGAVLVAALRAADAKNGQQIVYSLPAGGAPFWFDSMAIPKGAAHADNALRFIDYILRPDVVAKISNKVMYPNPNRAATPLVDKRLTSNPAIYPDAAAMRTLWVKRPMPPRCACRRATGPSSRPAIDRCHFDEETEVIPTGLLFDPAFLTHRQGDLVYVVPNGALIFGEHFDSPLRLAYTKQLLDAVGMTEQLTRIAFASAADEQLLRVHRPEYLRQLAEACAVAGEQVVQLGEDAAGSASTERIARLAAGAACAAVDTVMTGPLRQAYALIRPSGHHAGADFAMGYCYYNNVAIAARHAQAAHGIERVAIVDWDVHHGNGTQQVFYDDPSVMFVSLHEAENFPVDGGEARETGGGAGAGYNVNVPLPSGTGDAGYQHAFDELVLPLIDAFAPQLILVSAGQDANAFDPLGRMRVQRDGFRHMARALRQAAGSVCDGRIAMLQEGGYSLPYLPIATLGVLEGLVGWNAPFDDPHLFVQHPLGDGERGAVAAARAAQAPYWSALRQAQGG